MVFGDEDNLNEIEFIVDIKEDVIKLNVIDLFRDVVNNVIDNMFNGELC